MNKWKYQERDGKFKNKPKSNSGTENIETTMKDLQKGQKADLSWQKNNSTNLKIGQPVSQRGEYRVIKKAKLCLLLKLSWHINLVC